jgi:hypothetical protein
MDFEAAILMAIAMAVTVNLCARPVAVSYEWLNYAIAHPVLCTDVEMGMPCSDDATARRVKTSSR